MKVCSKCGMELSDDAEVCGKCNTRLPEIVPPPMPTPVVKSMSKKLIAIIAIVVVAVVVIALVSYVVMRQEGGAGIFGEKDSDGDGHPDGEDAFPNDSSEWKDSDNDGHGDNSDAFPNNPSEWKDSDSDGVGDNADAFPNDSSETKDSDNDGVGDNADAFPNDATETKDSDNDGVGDNSDAFPTNPDEQYDSDNDGVGNNADAFPYDSTQWADRDGDGYGDNPSGNNPDAFPDDPTEWKDSDSDGIGDNDDIYDSGNGGIKVYITSYQGDGSSDESGAPDPYFNISIYAYEGGGWKLIGGKTSSVYTNQDAIDYPLTLTIDVDDDIPYVYVSISATDDDFWSSDDTIDLNGTSTGIYSAHCYFYPATSSYSSFSDDGRLDLADEMDGEIEWYCQVVEM